MISKALYVRLKAKPGKEAEVEAFLKNGLALVEREPATRAWFAMKMSHSTYGIFDAFPDEEGRDAHLTGEVAKALFSKAEEMLAETPTLQKIDLLATKLPDGNS